MGAKNNFVGRCLAAQPTTRRSDRCLKNLLRSLRKISSEQMGAERHLNPLADDHEPFELGERAILRLQGQVPVDLLVRLHNIFKNEHMAANEILEGLDPDHKLYPLIRCAVRALCEEQLKTTAQLSGIYPPDPEMTVSTQQLFEQFYEAHGKPNDAEKDLLVLVGYVDGNVIDQWFAAKEFRQRAVTVMERKILSWKLQFPSFFARVKAQELERQKPKKSIHRH